MTVSELRAALQALETQGHGDLPVGFDFCECHDSDYTMAIESVGYLEIEIADNDRFAGSQSIPDGMRFLKLS